MHQGKRAHPTEEPGEEDTSRNMPRVLVVDDDVTVRSLAVHHLGAAGFDVVTLAEGGTVEETFRTIQPDVVLLDVVLPDRDGFSLCRELRTLPGAEHLPIAMLTSLNDGEAIRTAYEAGATEFLPKPLNWLHEAFRIRYLLRAAATMRDLRTAREAIAQGKAEWEETFDAIDDPVMVMSPDLEVVRANRAAARFARLSVDELPGRRCCEVHRCARSAEGACPVQRAVVQGTPVHDELRGYGLDGRDCLVTASPVMDARGQPVAVVYTIKDVSEYRQLEREFLHAQKMEALGVLAAGVAHDFNNLLQGIAAFAQFLSLEGRSPVEIRDGLKEIGRIATKGGALTRQLLLTARKASAVLGPIALSPIVEEVAELLRRTTSKKITIEASSAPDLWPVLGEEGLLHQALTNVAINAVHAMPAAGTLSIGAENTVVNEIYCRAHPDCQPGRHVVISIADTGCGMDRATMEKIYEPFFTTKGPAEGTGLGLSVVYGIVRQHGGHVRCDSELGVGTTFRLYFPASADELPTVTEEDAGRSRRSLHGQERTVLLVDDEPEIRSTVGRYLVHHGYRVVTAGSGRDALRRVDAHGAAIQAIVLDLNMPGTDGESCLTELASRGCRVPVLMATGALLDPDREERLLQHAAGIMRKPFDLDGLLQALAEVLAPRAGDPAGSE